MDDRRKYSRKKVNSRVKVFHPKIGSFESKTKDISNGGILIAAKKGTEAIQNNDSLKVIFLDSEDIDIIFNMIVVRTVNNEIGLKFINCEKKGKTFEISDLRDVLC